MKILRKLLTYLGLLCIALLIGASVYLFTRPEKFYTSLLSKKLSETLERKTEIKGPLAFEFGKTPSLEVSGFSIANTNWGKAKNFVEIERAKIRIPLLSLLRGNFIIKELEVYSPRLFLETKDGKDNWSFPTSSDESPSSKETEESGAACGTTLDTRAILLKDALIKYDQDEDETLSHKLEISELQINSASFSENLKVVLKGILNDAKIKIDSQLQRFTKKQGDIKGYKANFSSGKTIADFQLELKEKAGTCVPELGLKIAGDSLSEIGKIGKAELPPLGPYELALKLTQSSNTLKISDIAIKIKESDLSGDLAVELNSVPKITGQLSSTLLKIDDFSSPETEPAQEEEKEDGPLFSDEELPLEALSSFESEIAFELAKVIRGEDDLATKLSANFLNSKELTKLSILSGELYEGETKGDISLKRQADGAQLNWDTTTSEIHIGPLLDMAEKLDAIAKLDIDLHAVGNSPKQLVNSLGGSLSVAALKGHFDNIILKILTAGIYDLLRPIFGMGGESNLRCFVQKFEFVEGVADIKSSTIYASDLALIGKGKVNLPKEELDLKFSMKSKNPGLATLLIPFTVSGEFDSPNVLPDLAGVGKELISAPLTIAKDTASRVKEIGEMATGNNNPNALSSFCQKALEKAGLKESDVVAEKKKAALATEVESKVTSSEELPVKKTPVSVK